MPRLRLSSLEPWDLSPAFFELWENRRLCPHLHLPLQSGCDATLRRMRRQTSQSEFRELLRSAQRAIPNLRVTTDVIVGFPGETDREFDISRDFIRRMNFGGLHVFRYSNRPGTPASRMKRQVSNRVKKSAQPGTHRSVRSDDRGLCSPDAWLTVPGTLGTDCRRDPGRLRSQRLHRTLPAGAGNISPGHDESHHGPETGSLRRRYCSWYSKVSRRGLIVRLRALRPMGASVNTSANTINEPAMPLPSIDQIETMAQ